MSTNQNAAHTPGPWEFDDGGEGPAPYYIFAGDEEIARLSHVTGPNALLAMDRKEFSLPRDEQYEESIYRESLEYVRAAEHCANARLIAAAPELLDALRYILEGDPCNCLAGDMYGECDFCKGRAAIAKATGGAA